MAKRDRGIYIAVFHLPRRRRIRVGALGVAVFEPGIYLYVGSAQRNLDRRLARHARRHKARRWHIDYLSSHARMIGALVLRCGKAWECRLARVLARRLPAGPLAGFGSSDCRCATHLFVFPQGLSPKRPRAGD